ncbi:MAG TPA: endolytic transglycosylase MltG [Gaiellaceae bacterium]|nr:endolytic transglycosylase MltG [Gaiellaceae bacterium]
MAERGTLSHERPSRGQIRRRRMTALIVLVLAVVVIGVAVGAALPHLHRHRAAPPPPPPPPKPFRIVFPEGFTRVQMAERVGVVAGIAERKRGGAVRLSSATYGRATRRLSVPCFSPRLRTDTEGFLFPATYDFLAKTTSTQLARDQVQAFCGNWRTLDLSYARSKNLTPYDVLTIASMIEKEAEAPAERPLIAAVIYNRLRERMPLGIDSTLRYGLDIAPTQSITESQLQSNSPYNTRDRLGLPPTPIANPGLASMRAAAHPAKVDYLYFVRKPDKVHHFFTASASEFQQYECAHGYGC